MDPTSSDHALEPVDARNYILSHSNDPTVDLFRPILALTGDFHLKADEAVRLRSGVAHAKFASWLGHQSVFSSLHSLKLDLSTVRSASCWETILERAPEQFRLPQLTTLKICMDQVDEHIQFALRFFLPSITDLSLSVHPPRRPLCYRTDVPRYTTVPQTALEAYLETVQDEWYATGDTKSDLSKVPIMILCAGVTIRIPKLHHMQFVVADVNTAARVSGALATLTNHFKTLETLCVARHTAVPPFLSQISGHPSLRVISAFQEDFPLAAIRYPETRTEEQLWHQYGAAQPAPPPLLQLDGLCTRLTALTLEVALAHFRTTLAAWATHGVRFPAATRLRLGTSPRAAGLAHAEDELHDALRMLPALFPALAALAVGPVRWAPHARAPSGRTRRFRVTGATLLALVRLGTLEHLALSAAYQPEVAAAEWAALLPAWPRLRTLALPATQPLCVRVPAAPLDAVLRVFAACCPRLEALAVHTSPPEGTVPRLRAQMQIAHSGGGVEPGLVHEVVYACEERPELDHEHAYLMSLAKAPA